MVDTHADLWALGVLLYKLCYRTTPFETGSPHLPHPLSHHHLCLSLGGKLQILNGRYTTPSTPTYSAGLVALIDSLLSQDPDLRPSAAAAEGRAIALMSQT